MQCYFVLLVFLFACSLQTINGYNTIRPIYVRPLTHYALGRDVRQQQQQQQQQLQLPLQHHQQLEYIINDDEDDDSDGGVDEQEQEQQYNTATAAALNIATIPLADDLYGNAEFTPVYVETDDYSFLPDRMPDLSDEEFVAAANDEHQTPLTYLKHSEQVRLLPNTMNGLDLPPSAQPIYITMPIYINSPNAEQQRPMFMSMSTLPLALRPPTPPAHALAPTATLAGVVAAAAAPQATDAAAEMEEPEIEGYQPAYVEEMEPLAVEEPPSSHYNRLLRNYFHMARAFGVGPAGPHPAHARALAPTLHNMLPMGRAATLGRMRQHLTPAARLAFMPAQQRHYRHMTPPQPHGYFGNLHFKR